MEEYTKTSDESIRSKKGQTENLKMDILFKEIQNEVVSVSIEFFCQNEQTYYPNMQLHAAKFGST